MDFSNQWLFDSLTTTQASRQLLTQLGPKTSLLNYHPVLYVGGIVTTSKEYSDKIYQFNSDEMKWKMLPQVVLQILQHAVHWRSHFLYHRPCLRAMLSFLPLPWTRCQSVVNPKPLLLQLLVPRIRLPRKLLLPQLIPQPHLIPLPQLIPKPVRAGRQQRIQPMGNQNRLQQMEHSTTKCPWLSNSVPSLSSW